MNCYSTLRYMHSISIRLRSDKETSYMHFSYCDLLYSKIRKRFVKNNGFCGHYYDEEDLPQFVLYYKNKPLPDRPIHFSKLNVHEHDTIDLQVLSLNGGHPPFYFYPILGAEISLLNDGMSYPPLEIDKDLNIEQFVTIFGCTLFEDGLRPSPYGGIYVADHTNGSELLLPRSLWYEKMHGRTLIIGYQENINIPNATDFYKPWPESDFEFSSDEEMKEQSGMITETKAKLFDIFASNTKYDKEYISKLIEDLLILVEGLYSSCENGFSASKIIRTFIIFLKLRRCSSIMSMFEDSRILDYITKMLSEPDEESGLLEALDGAENLIDAIKAGKKLKITKVLYRLGMFAMTMSIFDGIGLNLDLLGYDTFDKEILKRKYKLTGDVMLDIADGVVFLLKKGYQIILTKRVDAIYHTDDEYSQLYDDITDLKIKKVALSNPSALGFNEYWYGDKLDKTIEKLKTIIKYAATLDKSEVRYWRSQLCELQLIKNNILIAKNVSESREVPFSVLFFASPGVGKSSLTKLTFQHLAKTHDLPTDDKFMYVRNPVAKYADGFKSEMHTIVLDDIGFKHPTKNPTGDISLDEVYMIVGTFQYVPDQAALEDKGKIPCRIKFLLGTTNVKDLNSYHYFSVPSAFQRRFPYIVEVFVKKEYQMDDGSGMLDANKAYCHPDFYPDYWELKVSKIVVPKDMSQLAKLNHIATFSNIDEYTAWLSKTSISHFANEKIMTTSFKNMQKIAICKTCYMNTNACTCLTEQSGTAEFVLTGMLYYFALFVYFFYRAMAAVLADRLYWYCRLRCESAISNFNYENVNEFVRRRMLVKLSEKIRENIGYHRAFGILAATIITGYAVFKFRRTIAGVTFAEQSEKVVDIDKKTQARAPKPCGEEKELTWVASDKKLSLLDLSPAIVSSNQHSREDFNARLGKNVLRLMIYDEDTPKERYVNNAIVVKSNIVMCNAHYFNNVKNDKFKMIIVGDTIGEGVNDKIEIFFDKKLIYRDAFKDLAIFVLHAIPPRRDISNYFASESVYTLATGTLVARTFKTGEITYNTVHDVKLEPHYSDTYGKHPYCGPASIGRSVLLTEDGDCGSVLVLHTPKGHFIAGLHRAGSPTHIVVGIWIYKSFLDEFLQNVNPLAVSAGVPNLAPEHTTLQSLHPKSVFNYIESGSAQVFGSISNFKTNQKSRVCATPMREFLVSKGYPVDYRSPQLKGYMPYFLAGKDLVDPITRFDETLLSSCADSFYLDIMEKLDPEEIATIVHKYDMFTVTNGAAGVAFVDSVNRSTSTGYPHCTTKRKFLNPIPPERGLSEPMEFTEEIIDEVSRLIDEYTNLRRGHVVYKATLKDEQVSLLKYIMGKTRLFGSAPISFVLVQRIYFLSIIRLMQKHKMEFECAIGVIAQTKEWELFYDRVNTFPNCIAGDFSKFDKKMCPLVIMLAYRVLIRIAEASGNYSRDDLNIMFGIATDTAYPFMLFNGDFVQFFGSNPSGHPLTVIINSIVNCIYLRYVFVTLYKENVKSEESDLDICRKFQKHIKLFVYGDDNQGSTDLEWFNFSNIQRVFDSVGIKYTPPTKDDSSYDFMPISEVDFLKRSYRYDEDLKAIVAPLALDSLNKMLTTWVASETVSPEVQTLDVLGSAIREYFFHGREIFQEKRQLFIELLKHLNLEHGINTTVLPTYEMLVERYNDSSEKVLARLPAHSFKEQSVSFLPVECEVSFHHRYQWIFTLLCIFIGYILGIISILCCILPYFCRAIHIIMEARQNYSVTASGIVPVSPFIENYWYEGLIEYLNFVDILQFIFYLTLTFLFVFSLVDVSFPIKKCANWTLLIVLNHPLYFFCHFFIPSDILLLGAFVVEFCRRRLLRSW